MTDLDPRPPVLACHDWPTNGDLIADVARLGYLDGLVLDPTFGRGKWWTRWEPDALVATDLDPRGQGGVVAADFRRLPFADSTFDAAAFDPPYVSVGGRKTTGLPDYHDRYGIDDAPTTPAGVQAQIDAGLAEMARVVRPRGHVLVKCQDYVSSGRLQPGTHWTLSTALGLGMDLVDRLEHHGAARPQPPRWRLCRGCRGKGGDDAGTCQECHGEGRLGSPQVHARRNLSTLLVLRLPRG